MEPATQNKPEEDAVTLSCWQVIFDGRVFEVRADVLMLQDEAIMFVRLGEDADEFVVASFPANRTAYVLMPEPVCPEPTASPDKAEIMAAVERFLDGHFSGGPQQ